MITAAVGIIKTIFLHYYLISLAKSFPQQPVLPQQHPVWLLGGDTDLLPAWSHRASLSLTPPSRFEIRLKSPRAFTTSCFSVFTHQKLQWQAAEPSEPYLLPNAIILVIITATTTTVTITLHPSHTRRWWVRLHFQTKTSHMLFSLPSRLIADNVCLPH